jgi:two-component system response regulator MtrA
VVEDDESLGESICLVLASAGMAAVVERDGAKAVDRFADVRPDAVVLDLMLPGMHGLDVCRALRRVSGVPIVVVTARAETESLVVALEAGADDYVTKPFEPAELIARLRAVLRRSGAEHPPAVLRIGELAIDPAAFRATKRDEPLDLTATEFRVLHELAAHAGRVLTREHLLHHVWKYDYLGDSRLVDMAIKRVREKVEDNPSQPRYVTTVRGVGYRMERGG